jgi:pentose-5-phosphate-3-epimerase
MYRQWIPSHLRAPIAIRDLRHHLEEHGLDVLIQADGGIRRQSVPLLKAAGADAVTAGSLLLQHDHAEFQNWIRAL